MNPAKNYDLVIIGSGPGGYVAALYASRKKLNVCVIEKDLSGGTCLNRGCIPTKALLQSASILSKVKESKEFGIEVDNFRINFPVVISRKETIVTRLRTGIETLFRANKIELIKGLAKIKSSGAVTVNGEDIAAKSIIVASGSRPGSIPGITIDEVDTCSSDGILNLKEIPKNITIVGGGAIGCEFASLFNTLGSNVTIVELLDRILPTQSKEASRKMETLFKKRGVVVRTSTKFDPASSPGAKKVLIAVGRKANIEGLGLEEMGIEIKNGRIAVDENLRTSVKNIYAIGDCVPGPQLAHKASYDGILAVDNIVGEARQADYSCVPNCIWTDPEIASVGLTEEEAKARYTDVKIAKFPYLASGKAYIMGKPEGFIKIIGDPKGDILGVEIFGEEACDLIAEAVLAKARKINIKDVSHVIHGHPTLSEIFQEAAHIFCGTPIHSV
ncbi:MAG: dihydrolipoyl dehydrogenase [Candidatus Omnitrophota bacterium]|nr:dihydrolipoyl dehydrogenase [Candidatus Omnitrophota bacterium]